MSSKKTKNTALSTAQAFHYQALIGLDKCFSLKEGQAVWLEKDGDVSLLGGNVEQSTQIEVKDYSSPLTDHHENLWKTLKNWLSPEFEQRQYGAFILHTTQAFGATTRLKEWNTQTAEERLHVLKDIYGERPSEQTDIEETSKIFKLQKAVMETEQSLLLAVLKKTFLHTESDDSEAIKEDIFSKLIGIPKNNKNSYLDGLVGFVYNQGEQTSWRITYTEFCAKQEELTSVYCKKKFPFPPFVGDEASSSQVEQHQDKPFVKKIYDIDYSEVIPDAVGNWIELQNSLIAEFDESPIYKNKTKDYQKQLVKRYKLHYSSAQLGVKNKTESSKLLYNDTIAEPPLNLGNDTPPIEYKNGLIHDAMDRDELDLKWKVEP